MSQLFYWGKVTDNEDPDGLHRVKVSKQGEEENVTDWLPVVTSYAGADTGLSFLPDIDDQVLVVSLDTWNARKAVVGSIWSNKVKPPETGENTDADLNGDGKNSLRFIKSRSGNQVIFDDTEKTEKVQLISHDGTSRLELSLSDELFTLDTEKDLSINAKGAITIQAEEIDVTSEKQVNVTGEENQIAAKKELDINSDKDIGLKGSGIALN
jgi:uncharacterized protein involved in type VI secretion and phage assembly